MVIVRASVLSVLSVWTVCAFEWIGAPVVGGGGTETPVVAGWPCVPEAQDFAGLAPAPEEAPWACVPEVTEQGATAPVPVWPVLATWVSVWDGLELLLASAGVSEDVPEAVAEVGASPLVVLSAVVLSAVVPEAGAACCVELPVVGPVVVAFAEELAVDVCGVPACADWPVPCALPEAEGALEDFAGAEDGVPADVPPGEPSAAAAVLFTALAAFCADEGAGGVEGGGGDGVVFGFAVGFEVGFEPVVVEDTGAVACPPVLGLVVVLAGLVAAEVADCTGAGVAAAGGAAEVETVFAAVTDPESVVEVVAVCVVEVVVPAEAVAEAAAGVATGVAAGVEAGVDAGVVL